MFDDITTKLRKTYNSKKEHWNEADVIYLMVQIRKLIKEFKDHKLNTYKYLCFFSDWVLHARKNCVADIVHILKELEVSKGQMENDFANLTLLKTELSQALTELNIYDFTKDTHQFGAYIYLLLEVLRDNPIEVRKEDQDKYNLKIESFELKGFDQGLPRWNIKVSGVSYSFNSNEVFKKIIGLGLYQYMLQQHSSDLK